MNKQYNKRKNHTEKKMDVRLHKSAQVEKHRFLCSRKGSEKFETDNKLIN